MCTMNQREWYNMWHSLSEEALFSSALCELLCSRPGGKEGNCIRSKFVGRREGVSLGQFLPDDLISFVKKEKTSSTTYGWASGGLGKPYQLPRGRENGAMWLYLSCTSTVLSHVKHFF